MLDTIRNFGTNESGGTIFENSLLAVVVVITAVTLLGQVEESVRDVFRNSAIQADTDRQYRQR